jgi:hypothetical protein
LELLLHMLQEVVVQEEVMVLVMDLEEEVDLHQ